MDDGEKRKAECREGWRPSPADLGRSLFILEAATGSGFLFERMGLSDANIIMVYILGVLVIAALTASHVCSFTASLISVLAFNFLFTEPRFTLHAYDRDYPVTLIIMFVSSLLMGTLAARLNSHAKQSAQSAFRMQVLLETNQLLQKADSDERILRDSAGQLIKLLGRPVIVYPACQGVLGDPKLYERPGDSGGAGQLLAEGERAAARWVFENNRRAGASSETFSDARCLYLAIQMEGKVYGVAGIVVGSRPLDSFENSVALSILGECALALENRKNAREKEEAAVLAKNEQLRADLLRSISHDLRTPLTSISGNASNLLSNGDGLDAETKAQIYGDIYEDSLWLINLVENLLAVTRIEEGRMNIRLSAELMDEVITEALRHVNRRGGGHEIIYDGNGEMLLAKIDARLIVQVIVNIVDNAVKYTPPGSHILIEAGTRGDMVEVRIADDGPGIPDEIKPRVFDMFYSGANTVADSRRSLGLGLSLCRSIVSAHGGEITVEDNVPRGTVFTFTLPSGEVDIHE